MVKKAKLRAVVTAVLVLGVMQPAAGLAAELQKSTQKILEELKLPATILDGLDDELSVPAEWVDAARKEGSFTILGSWKQEEFDRLSAPFKERYPFITVRFSRASAFYGRAMAPLIAYKEGQYVADITTGFGGARELYIEADALEDLRSLPNFDKPMFGNDEQGRWAAIRSRYWCMAYNTNLVKKEDLPKTWDDLVTNKFWHNGNLGIGNRPQLWLSMLQGAHGTDWVTQHIDQLFTIVKPQLRKEGLDALVGLAVAGEFHASLPSDPSRVHRMAQTGAPISFHCPDPVPTAISQIGILKGSPRVNAARLWTNWLLSKEGQVAQFYAEGTAPSHKELQRAELLAYSDELLGRNMVQEDHENLNALGEIWKARWSRGTGR